MSFRDIFLLAAVAFTLFAHSAHAASCPGLVGKGVTVQGEAIEHMKGAGMLKIQTGNCGKITIGIPASNKAELNLYVKSCPKVSFMVAEGDVLLGILQAKELDCLWSGRCWGKG